MSSTKPAVFALAVCALSDLAAVPLILGSDDAPAIVGALVGILSVLTLVAAVGLARNATWGRRLAVATRVADVAAALPAVTAATGVTIVAAVVTIVLSLATLVLLWRRQATPAITRLA